MKTKYSTLDEYLADLDSSLSKLIKDILVVTLEIPKQILSFIKDEKEYAGTINVSGDMQLSLDVASHELFLQKLPKEDYYLLLGEETTPENITEGTGEFIILGDFIDGSSIVRSRGPGGIILITDKQGNIQAAMTVSYTLFLRFDLATEAGYIQFIHADGEFFVLKDDLSISPSSKPVYGFGGKEEEFTEKEKEFVNKIKKVGKLRYGGCLVQDMNNILDKTGVFAYFSPKLRLCYEILPYLYILSKVNGKGYYITKNKEMFTLETAPRLEPNKLTEMDYLHQKVGFVGGSSDLVDLL
ncbi:MAG: hypothetical protein ACTSRR_02190 [Candidatus Heimdallarchaeaceae archaeon]